MTALWTTSSYISRYINQIHFVASFGWISLFFYFKHKEMPRTPPPPPLPNFFCSLQVRDILATALVSLQFHRQSGIFSNSKALNTLLILFCFSHHYRETNHEDFNILNIYIHSMAFFFSKTGLQSDCWECYEVLVKFQFTIPWTGFERPAPQLLSASPLTWLWQQGGCYGLVCHKSHTSILVIYIAINHHFR